MARKTKAALKLQWVLDAHVHLWEYSWTPWVQNAGGQIGRDWSARDFARIAKPCGVTNAIVVQVLDCTNKQGGIEEANRLIRTAKSNDWILGVVTGAKMWEADEGNITGWLQQLQYEPKVVGVREIFPQEPPLAPTDHYYRDANFIRNCGYLVRHRLSLDLLARQSKRGQLVEVRKFLLENAPGALRVIIDHGAKPTGVAEGTPSKAWKNFWTEVSKRDNTWVKISGLTGEAVNGSKQPVRRDLTFKFLDHLANTMGVDRLVWGGDWPVSSLAGSYDDALGYAVDWATERGLGSDEIANVFFFNGLKAYGLR